MAKDVMRPYLIIDCLIRHWSQPFHSGQGLSISGENESPQWTHSYPARATNDDQFR